MPFLSFIQQTIPDLRLATVVGTVTLFAIPSTLLGMVSPYAVKLKMRALANSGETVGELYAISTVGSITGTFLSGFFLLTHIGNTNLLFLIALILIATSLIANRSKYLMMQIMAIAAVLLAIYLNGAIHRALAGRSVLDIDTPYQRVLVYDSTDRKTGRPIRGIVTDQRGTQSAIFLDSTPDLVFDYAKYYRLADHFRSDIVRGLIIGGAGYTYPRDFLRQHPTATVDVVEVDPGMTEIARNYFSLTEDPRLYHPP